MRRTGRLACLLLLFFLPAAVAAQETSLTGKVVRVYDGDTLEVAPVGKVRLLGIDCPEREASERDLFLTRQGVAEQRLREIYRQAKQFSIHLAGGREVVLVPGDPQRDRHGRLLAYLRLPDGRLLNRLLLEQGLAVVYRRFDFGLKKDFLAAEKAARTAKRGLWAGTRPGS